MTYEINTDSIKSLMDDLNNGIITPEQAEEAISTIKAINIYESNHKVITVIQIKIPYIND